MIQPVGTPNCSLGRAEVFMTICSYKIGDIPNLGFKRTARAALRIFGAEGGSRTHTIVKINGF
jgi:hypothetical protein